MFNNFPATKYISEYNSSKNKLGIPHVTVSHSHGFFPSVVATSTPHSIVLSCYEYMEGYLNGYAKKKLRSQLKHSNIIIGNSMADYEEQKVFYSNHRRNRAHFDFIFLKSNGTENLWMDRYQTIYFIKMGVIPVFFSDFDEMNGYLKRL